MPRKTGKHRYLNAAVAFPRRKPGKDGYRPCRVCGKTCSHRSMVACSTKCRINVRVVAFIGEQKAQVYKRDKGVCALCGFDTAKLARALRWSGVRLGYMWPYGKYIPHDVRPIWEMDHIVPVSEGGGVYAGISTRAVLANLRTLCEECHKGVTKDLACMRAKGGRDAKRRKCGATATGGSNPLRGGPSIPLRG